MHVDHMSSKRMTDCKSVEGSGVRGIPCPRWSNGVKTALVRGTKFNCMNRVQWIEFLNGSMDRMIVLNETRHSFEKITKELTLMSRPTLLQSFWVVPYPCLAVLKSHIVMVISATWQFLEFHDIWRAFQNVPACVHVQVSAQEFFQCRWKVFLCIFFYKKHS